MYTFVLIVFILIVVVFAGLVIYGFDQMSEQARIDEENRKKYNEFLYLLSQNKIICAECNSIVEKTKNGICEVCGANISDVKCCKECGKPFHYNPMYILDTICPTCLRTVYHRRI